MIVDFHTHIFSRQMRDHRDEHVRLDPTFGELFSDPKAKMATAEELLQAMDEDEVDRAVIMSIGWTDQGLARQANDYIIESVIRYPDRLIGFASVNPVWGEVVAKEADRCARAGLRGVGELHPDTQGFSIADRDILESLMMVVQEHKLLVSTHSSEPVGHLYPGKGRTRPQELWQFICNFPNVTVICSHWGGGLPFYSLMPEVRSGMDNVYFDTAASPFLYDARVFEVAVSLVGADRILLASDYPLLRTNRLISQLQSVSLSESAKESIVGGNAAKIFGL